MRILLGTHQFFPEFRAGTETLALRTAQELQRRGHRVAVLTGGRHDATRPAVDHYIFGTIEVIRIDEGAQAPPLAAGALAATYRRPGLRAALDKVLDDFQPDVVHAFHFRRLTLTLVDACAARRLPLLATLTDYWTCCPTGQLQLPNDRPCPGPEPDAGNCLRHLAGRIVPGAWLMPAKGWALLGRWLARDATAALAARPAAMRAGLHLLARVLVPTAPMAATLARNGFDLDHLRVCPYGIDLAGADASPRSNPWQPGAGRPFEIGFIGTLNAGKGALVLIEAMARLDRDPPRRVRIYGKPDEDAAYGGQVRAAAGKAGDIELCGTFEPEAVFPVLSGFDVLVVPSVWRENSPLIIQQAQAAGIPVVASRVDGISHLIDDGVNGLLFEPGRPEQLATCLRRLQAESGLLERLAAAAVRPRGITDYVDELETHHAEIIAGNAI